MMTHRKTNNKNRNQQSNKKEETKNNHTKPYSIYCETTYIMIKPSVSIKKRQQQKPVKNKPLTINIINENPKNTNPQNPK